MSIELLVGEHKLVAALVFNVDEAHIIEKLIKRGINTWHPEPPKEILAVLTKLQALTPS